MRGLKVRLCVNALLVAIAMLTLAAQAGAKQVNMPSNAKYDGAVISTEQAASSDLACFQSESGALSCYDSFEAMKNSPAALAEAPKASVSRNKKARAASGNTFMLITEHSYFNQYVGGWTIAGYARQNWYNLNGGYDNSATSVDAGNHSGYLAQYLNGGGRRLNRPIYSECYNLSGCDNFNDITSSRYRN